MKCAITFPWLSQSDDDKKHLESPPLLLDLIYKEIHQKQMIQELIKLETKF